MYALIDGDILVYRAAFAAERTKYTAHEIVDEETGVPESTPFWDDYDHRAMLNYIKENDIGEYVVIRTKEVDEEAIAIYNVREMLSRIADNLVEKFSNVTCLVALSTGEESFRHGIATHPYKASRKDVPKPVHYQAVRQYLKDKWDAFEFKSVEADDVLALAQDDDSIICSIDKDLLQIPGLHYHIVDGTVRQIGEDFANFHLWKQVLTGDRTDDIPGIWRVGDAKAHKLLTTVPPQYREEAVLGRWIEYGETKKYEEEWGDVEPEDAMREVLRLVTVGGEDAKEALSNAEEEKKQVQVWLRGRDL